MLKSYGDWKESLLEEDQNYSLEILYNAIDASVSKLFSQIQNKLDQMNASKLQRQALYTHILNKMMEVGGLSLDIPGIGKLKKINSGERRPQPAQAAPPQPIQTPSPAKPGRDDWQDRFEYGKKKWMEIRSRVQNIKLAKQELKDDLLQRYPSWKTNKDKLAALNSTIEAIVQDIEKSAQTFEPLRQAALKGKSDVGIAG